MSTNPNDIIVERTNISVDELTAAFRAFAAAATIAIPQFVVWTMSNEAMRGIAKVKRELKRQDRRRHPKRYRMRVF